MSFKDTVLWGVFSNGNSISARYFDVQRNSWLEFVYSKTTTESGVLRYCKTIYDETNPLRGYLITNTAPAGFSLDVSRHDGGVVYNAYTAENIAQFDLSRSQPLTNGNIPFVYIAQSDTVSNVIKILRRPSGQHTSTRAVSCGTIATAGVVHDLKLEVSGGLIYLAFDISDAQQMMGLTCPVDNTGSSW
ncbi:hypothetical protein SARC_04944 [Sphaeroforma arctica JP610]|uniref:Uncharacterized protein n=1 Tax=Sphaeroforma arctica JP610 TaxID=667725 RepID=A0A0L0G1T0_9EUKA|nr:hypothetical protein SARC_04944 [Sphaeroforma arctica JP610]KNC82786.1 hypothetical protein SARC_04944 [Sphaeroforma arctica JP610]|eukprot:XP_014156688.1 hypothetical protein SARC_04944 [Sphaeroforma arctica JP610]